MKKKELRCGCCGQALAITQEKGRKIEEIPPAELEQMRKALVARFDGEQFDGLSTRIALVRDRDGWAPTWLAKVDESAEDVLYVRALQSVKTWLVRGGASLGDYLSEE